MNHVNVWVVRRKLKKGFSYMVQWVQEGRVRSESSGRDKAFARKRAEEVRQLLREGRLTGIKARSFADFQVEHLEHVKVGISLASYIQHEISLRHFSDICRPEHLGDIDFGMIERFRDARQGQGVGAATVNKELRTLKASLQAAVNRGYLKANPFKGKSKALFIREPEPEPKRISYEDFAKLEGAATNNNWRAVLALGYFAGMRKEEILNLEWAHVDFDAKQVRIENTENHRTKSRKRRIVPLHPRVEAAIQALSLGRLKNPLVITNTIGTKIAHDFSRDFAALCIRAGLYDEVKEGEKVVKRAHYTCHNLRDSFTTNLLEQGTDVKSVQKLLGHASSVTTLKHYAAVEAKGMAAAVERLGNVKSA